MTIVEEIWLMRPTQAELSKTGSRTWIKRSSCSSFYARSSNRWPIEMVSPTRDYSSWQIIRIFQLVAVVTQETIHRSRERCRRSWWHWKSSQSFLCRRFCNWSRKAVAHFSKIIAISSIEASVAAINPKARNALSVTDSTLQCIPQRSSIELLTQIHQKLPPAKNKLILRSIINNSSFLLPL